MNTHPLMQPPQARLLAARKRDVLICGERRGQLNFAVVVALGEHLEGPTLIAMHTLQESSPRQKRTWLVGGYWTEATGTFWVCLAVLSCFRVTSRTLALVACCPCRSSAGPMKLCLLVVCLGLGRNESEAFFAQDVLIKCWPPPHAGHAEPTRYDCLSPHQSEGPGAARCFCQHGFHSI